MIGGCTSCDRELFFSHRSSQGHAGRMMSLIGIKKIDAEIVNRRRKSAEINLSARNED
jgi:hypothetical protein